MRLTGARVFDLQEGFVNRSLGIEGARIVDGGEGAQIPLGGCTVIPGLIDLHFHGCMGADLSDGNGDGLKEIAAYELSRGVTGICPAGMTLREDALCAMCRTAAHHKAQSPAGAVLYGINLEGPFLSKAKKGAQNADWLQLPDIRLLRRLQQESDGLCKLVSIAPELPGALPFIEEASAHIRVSLAHTNADYDTAAAAFQKGAAHVTHLFNAMPPFTHRSPGVVGAAADSTCMAELIADGVHIHPSMVRAAFRLFGPERIILISDSIRATGLPEGSFTLGGQGVTVRGGRATLADGVLAGSVSDLMECMLRAHSMGIPLAHAVRAATYNPAVALGVQDTVGTLESGKQADLVVLDETLCIKAVLQKGRVVAGGLA